MARAVGDPVDFEVIREAWPKYRVSDGTTIKMRETLLDDRMVMVEGIPRYSITKDAQTSVMCDPDLRGEPASRAPTKELPQAIELHNMHCDAVSADSSSYVLDDGTKITISIGHVDVSRTRLHDRHGDRVYLIGRTPLVHATLAPQHAARPAP